VTSHTCCEPGIRRPGPPPSGPAPAVRWLGLEVLDSTDGRPFGGEGIAGFRARYTKAGRPGELRERGRFVRHDHAWTCIDGT